MKKKYTMLRIIAAAMKVAAILVLGLTVLAVIGVFGTGLLGGAVLDQFSGQFGQDTGGLGAFTGLVFALIAALVPIVLGGISAMILYAGGDAINLQIDIEENTRTTVLYLQQQVMALAPVSPPVQGPQFAPAEPAPLPVGADLQKNFCPQCGTKVEATDKNCPECNFELR